MAHPAGEDPSTQDYRGPEQTDDAAGAPDEAPRDRETPEEPGDAEAQPAGGAVAGA